MKEVWIRVIRYKKWLLLAVVIIAAISGGYSWYNSGKKTVATPGQVAKVERGDIATIVSASGNIIPVDMVDISSKITAQIREIKVNENDQVKAGQVLAILEDDQLKSELIQAQERLNNAAADLERNKRLSDIGAVSKQQMDSLIMNYNIAQASYNEEESKVNDTVITSPINGVVIGKPLPAGQMVAQGVNNPTVIMTVADMSKMQIEAQVDQTDIGKVAAGQPVTFTVDAYPDKQFTGIVSNISRKGVTQQNVIYYTVTIDVTEGQNLLYPNMVARVAIAVGESKDVLTVPLAAIRTDKNSKYVVVMNAAGQMENVAVTTGLVGDDRVEITSGLNEGDTIVIAQPKAQGQASNGQNNQRQGGQGGGNPMGSLMKSVGR